MANYITPSISNLIHKSASYKDIDNGNSGSFNWLFNPSPRTTSDESPQVSINISVDPFEEFKRQPISGYRFPTTNVKTVDYERPEYTFPELIRMAIQDSPNKKLRLRDIIAWIEAHYPYFSQKESDWKNCVRHSLSVNPMFFRDDMSVKCGRRGSYWNVKDIPLDAAAMKRRRKMKRKMSEAQLDCMNINNANAAFYAKNARRSLPEDVLRSNIAANIKAIKAMQSKKLDFDIDTIAKPHYEAFDRISSVTPEADDTISKIASIDQFISEMMYWDKIEL